jgi:pantothenate kinase
VFVGDREIETPKKEEGAMDEKKIQTLLDRMEIIDTETRYATGVDTRDRDVYRSCFTDEMELDMSGMGMGEPMKISSEVWADQAISLVSGFEATQHIITNHVITIEGDRATCVAYVQAQHFNPQNMYTVGGTYTNTLVRTPEGWKISKLKLTPSWTQNT